MREKLLLFVHLFHQIKIKLFVKKVRICFMRNDVGIVPYHSQAEHCSVTFKLFGLYQISLEILAKFECVVNVFVFCFLVIKLDIFFSL